MDFDNVLWYVTGEGKRARKKLGGYLTVDKVKQDSVNFQ